MVLGCCRLEAGGGGGVQNTSINFFATVKTKIGDDKNFGARGSIKIMRQEASERLGSGLALA